MMKIAILTSPNQWFIPYAEELNKKIKGSTLLFNHSDIKEKYDVIFILSYRKIIKEKYLRKAKHNIVGCAFRSLWTPNPVLSGHPNRG